MSIPGLARYGELEKEYEAAQRMCEITYNDWQGACEHLRQVERERRQCFLDLLPKSELSK